MQDAERAALKSPGAALLRLRNEGGERRIRWGNVLVAGVVMMSAGACGGLLFCALLQATLGGAPSVLSTILLTGPLSLFALVGALAKSRATPPRVPEAGKRISTAEKWVRLALALLIIPPLVLVTAMFIWYFLAKAPPAPHQVGVVTSATAHSMAHIGTNEQSVFFAQDSKQLHYALYYAGEFNSSGSVGRNGAAWTDEAGIKLKNGRSFGLWREGWNALFLKINGQEYDLRQGRVFELKDDGTVTQLPLSPGPVTKNTLPALGQAVREVNERRTESATGDKIEL
jgi:hypothetical protein